MCLFRGHRVHEESAAVCLTDVVQIFHKPSSSYVAAEGTSSVFMLPLGVNDENCLFAAVRPLFSCLQYHHFFGFVFLYSCKLPSFFRLLLDLFLSLFSLSFLLLLPFLLGFIGVLLC